MKLYSVEIDTPYGLETAIVRGENTAEATARACNVLAKEWSELEAPPELNALYIKEIENGFIVDEVDRKKLRELRDELRELRASILTIHNQFQHLPKDDYCNLTEYQDSLLKILDSRIFRLLDAVEGK